jgi:two-component system sensor histidine kinase CreC
MTAPLSPGWRLVYFIHHLISRVAPPLHSLHWKIFALLLVGLFLPAVYFLWQVRLTIERSHLRSTEQGMIDSALVLADAMKSPDALGSLNRAREMDRRVFRDLEPGIRVVVYDAEGRVLSDTEGVLTKGTVVDRNDVRRALSGKYGARWERDTAREVVILYATLPLFKEGRVTGAISVSKSTADVRQSVLRSLKDLAIPVAIAFLIAAGTSYLLSNYLTRVITDLAARAKRIADGEPDVRLETWTHSELGDLARALETMRRKLEGKAYIEEMASTLSHELKTPLAAIRGAADILAEADDETVRQRFVGNIRAETDRLTDIVNNLLALSRIETLPADTAVSSLPEVAGEVADAARARADALGITFQTDVQKEDLLVPVPADQLRRLLEILLENAFAFTPRGRAVAFRASGQTATVRDEGCGIEPALQARVFERFFTTPNPVTGRRGTGLGLAIAKSIVTRAQGTISLRSQPGRGTTLEVMLPSTEAGRPRSDGSG